jgi:hypothetical protein
MARCPSLASYGNASKSLESELCIRTFLFVDNLDRLQRVFQNHPRTFEILTPHRGGG